MALMQCCRVVVVLVVQLLLALTSLDLLLFGHGAHGIVNRDVLLTPQHGFHWQRSKRIFYEDRAANGAAHEAAAEASQKQRPWEHTLKHVTFLTVFANSSKDTGLRRIPYESFQQTPYIHGGSEPDVRFGDISTLAQGRLEFRDNRTYQFVEDSCDGRIIFKCANDTVRGQVPSDPAVALWLVQKIRHRDTKKQQFLYDIRFSIKPLPINQKGSRNNNDAKDGGDGGDVEDGEEVSSEESSYFPSILSHRNDDDEFRFRSYIQRLNDYPESLRSLNYAHQIVDDGDNSYSFPRRLSTHPGIQHHFPDMDGGVVPLSQTVAFNQNPESGNHLNIGEYYQDLQGNPPSDSLLHFHGDHFMPSPPPSLSSHMGEHKRNPILPNLLDFVFGKGTTSTNVKEPLVNNAVKFNEMKNHLHRYPATMFKRRPTLSGPTAPLITHHFHHYYYLPPPTPGGTMKTEAEAIPAILMNTPPSSSSLSDDMRSAAYHSAPSNVLVPPFQHIRPVHEEDSEEREENHQLHFSNQLRPAVNSHVSNQLPFLIYPASMEEEKEQHHEQQLLPPFRNGSPLTSPTPNPPPPFKQSEMDTGAIRYSDPDPIYHDTKPEFSKNAVEVKFQNSQESQDGAANEWRGREKLPQSNNEVVHLENVAKRTEIIPIIRIEKLEENYNAKNPIPRAKTTVISRGKGNETLATGHNQLKNTVSRRKSPQKSRGKSLSELRNNTRATATAAAAANITNISQITLKRRPDIEVTTTTTTTTSSILKEAASEIKSFDKENNVVTITTTATETIPFRRTAVAPTPTPTSTPTDTPTSPSTTVTVATNSILDQENLIVPRVIRKLKNVIVESRNQNSTLKDTGEPKPQSSTAATTTAAPSKPSEKAVLRWKLKRKTIPQEGFGFHGQRSNNNLTNVNVNNTLPSTAKDTKLTLKTNHIARKSPVTSQRLRHRKSSSTSSSEATTVTTTTTTMTADQVNAKSTRKSIQTKKNHHNNNNSPNDDNKSIPTQPGDKITMLEQVPGIRKFNRNLTTTSTTTTPIPEEKAYEVLTQKSISKSISFKVGANGEQIILINDDNDDNFAQSNSN